MAYYKRVVKSPVEVFRRQWHADGRGKLLEGLRSDDPLFNNDFGQVYVTTIKPQITKAWHMHQNQTDRMLLLRGTVRFGCVKAQVDIPTKVVLDLVMSDLDPYLIKIPKTIYHGFKNIGDTEAYILNIPDNTYDCTTPDEQRESPDKFVSFDWDSCLDG